MLIKIEELDDRFWSKVEKTETCWLWKRSLDNHGYGQFSVVRDRDGRLRHYPVKAHLAHWIAHRGEVPSSMLLRHTCGNHACVRLEHLEPTPRWKITEAAVAARLAAYNAPGKRERDLARFMEKVVKQENGCWLWFGARVVYGKFWLNKDHCSAHEASLILHGRLNPEKDVYECVRHMCPTEPNPRCVNPDHLLPGSFKENSADMLDAGRHRVGTMKLTAAEAACMRAEYVPREGELVRLSKKYGVTKQCVFDIVSGKRKDVAHIPLTTAPTGELPTDTRPRGSTHGRSKMTEEQVRNMRRQHVLGVAIPLLAQQNGISRRTAWEIIVGKTWKHVTD